MSASVIYPISIWLANRDRREKLKAEQQLIEQLEALSDAELASALKDLRRSEKREGERAR